MVLDDGKEPKKRRGTFLLVTTILVIATITGLYAIPPSYTVPDLSIRVAIIDSGINIDQELASRVVASKSFVNTTFGYAEDDNSTTDSSPGNIAHGTYIAKIIALEAPDAAIVNAKVVAVNDVATPLGIVEAIRWAVQEENCSVINLSLGLSPILDDFVMSTIQWAFRHGVSIVASAGNEGEDGVSGSSIESPAIYPEVIAVAAVDESNALYSFSSRGPLRDRTVKPDISASGYYKNNGLTVIGTSFAAPIITAGITRIIAHCINNGWSWTPGMIKAAIMISAEKLPYEEWEVGAGLLDLDSAFIYINNAQKPDGLPLIAAINPTESPFSFERFFVNHTLKIPVSIFTSSQVTFNLAYRGDDGQWLKGPSTVFVNQSGIFTLYLNVVANKTLEGLEAFISLYASGYLNMRFEMEFDARAAYREIAFDISHTSWSIDSSYGQFRELYRMLTKFGISVDELRYPENLTLDVLSSYDVIFILDPCAWDYVVEEDGYTYSKTGFYSYTSAEIATYVSYYNQGGNLFFTALSNSSIDQRSTNLLYSQFNLTLNNDFVPVISISINGIVSTELVTNMVDHVITRRVDSFDYNGCSLNYTGDAYEIAWVEILQQYENGTLYAVNKTVMVVSENSNGGRFVAAGSNFFLDNWALLNRYRSDQNLKLVLQSVYWLLDILND
ncbi:MAG: S8 family serine peptidase [Candidatus Thorarchaeota archaeon]